MAVITYKIEIFSRYYRRYDTYAERKKPWIAQIQGLSDDFEFVRVFLLPLTDYGNMNKPSTRGIELFYHLKEGVMYEIFEHLNWKKDKRWFAKNVNGRLVEMTKIEVKLELVSNA